MAKVTMEVNLRIMETVEIEDDKLEEAIRDDLTEDGKRRFAEKMKELLNVDHVEVTGVKHFILNE